MSDDSEFDIGDRPRTIYTVTLEEEAIDPPALVLIVKSPSGVQVSIFGELDQPHPITRAEDDDGNPYYYADIPCTAAGTWHRRWVPFDEDGVALDAFERSFRVKKSAFATPLPAP